LTPTSESLALHPGLHASGSGNIYSRLAQPSPEEGTHERLKSHLRELVDPKVGSHGGRIVKNTGDGFLAAFLARYAAPGDKLDSVVFAAPQLSLFEIAALADALDGAACIPIRP